MMGTELGGALVIGKKNRQVDQVVDILKDYFSHIRRENNLVDLAPSPAGSRPCLIVITEALDPRPDKNFVDRIRKEFPRAKILGLFDTLSHQLEKDLRRTGMIFLGSYEHFRRHFASIFSAAFNGKTTDIAAPPG